jgi:biotin carboxylase
MANIKGMRLLILGSNAISCDIVNAAKQLGIYTIVTDWNPIEKAPAKQIADEYWNDSLMDYDTLVPKIKDKGINGIITGFTDSWLLPYQHLCELTGLPCYATKKVFENTMDKAKFKQLCRDNGVPVIPEYQMETFDPTVITEKNKVIIKPVDNSGSRGVILCTKSEDYPKCLEYALSFSEKKQVVIEKYMEMDSISLSYTIQDGVVSLSTTDDRYVHKAANGGSVTNFGIYPSKYTKAYIEKIDGLMKSMYRNAGVKNGVIAVQFFTDGNEFYVMEMGHRLTGGQHYTYTMMENGISALDCLIHFAVTGKMADYSIASKDNAEFKNTYCHLFILGKQAKITRFEGLEFVESMPELTHLTQMKRVGDMIGADGTSAQKVLGLHLKVKNRTDLQRIFLDIMNKLHFYDEEGNDLMIKLNCDIL